MTSRFRSAGALVIASCVLAAAGAHAQAPAARPAPASPPAANAPAGNGPAASAPRVPEFKLILEQKAIDLLKATSARLAAAKAMSFTAVVSYEYPSKLGPPIVYSMRYDVSMRRPDKLKILTLGDGPASEFIYDGKAMMAYAPAEDLLAVAEAPPTVEGALKVAFQTAAIFYPFTDLLVDDPYAALSYQAKLAFHIGTSSVVGGVKTEMVAWSNDDVFMQIWIGAEDKLPRRIRAVYSADPLLLRHDMELSNWQIDAGTGADIAASEKAKAGRRIPFASPATRIAPAGAQPLSTKP
jgi:hypothetical protein